jgi:hypothetical protein
MDAELAAFRDLFPVPLRHEFVRAALVRRLRVRGVTSTPAWVAVERRGGRKIG